LYARARRARASAQVKHHAVHQSPAVNRVRTDITCLKLIVHSAYQLSC
jgi:hypothetical protein